MGTIPQLRLPHRIQVYAGTQPRINGARDIRSEVKTIKPFDDNGKPLFTFDTERYGKYIPSKKEFGREMVTGNHHEIMLNIKRSKDGMYEVDFDKRVVETKMTFNECFRHIVYEIMGPSMFEISYKYYKYLFEGVEDKFYDTNNAIGVYWIGDSEWLIRTDKGILSVESMDNFSDEKQSSYRERSQEYDTYVKYEAQVARQLEAQRKAKEAEEARQRRIDQERQLENLRKQSEKATIEKDFKLQYTVAELTAELIRKKNEEETAEKKARIADAIVNFTSNIDIDDLHDMSKEELNKRLANFNAKYSELNGVLSKIKNKSSKTYQENHNLLKNVSKELYRMNREVERRQRQAEAAKAKKYRQEHAEQLRKAREFSNEVRKNKDQRDAERDAARRQAEEQARREYEEQVRKQQEEARIEREKRIMRRDHLYIGSTLINLLNYDGIDRGRTHQFYTTVSSILKQARFLNLPVKNDPSLKSPHNRILPANYLSTFVCTPPVGYRSEMFRLLPKFDDTKMSFIDKDGNRMHDRLLGEYYNDIEGMYEFYTYVDAFERMLFFFVPFCLGQVDKTWYPSFIKVVFSKLAEARINESGVSDFRFNTGEHMIVKRIDPPDKPLMYKWQFSFPLGYSELRETMYGVEIRREIP